MRKGGNGKSQEIFWDFSVVLLRQPAGSSSQVRRSWLQYPGFSAHCQEGKANPRPHRAGQVGTRGLDRDRGFGNPRSTLLMWTWTVLQSQGNGLFSISKQQMKLSLQNASGLSEHSTRAATSLNWKSRQFLFLKTVLSALLPDSWHSLVAASSWTGDGMDRGPPRGHSMCDICI